MITKITLSPMEINIIKKLLNYTCYKDLTVPKRLRPEFGWLNHKHIEKDPSPYKQKHKRHDYIDVPLVEEKKILDVEYISPKKKVYRIKRNDLIIDKQNPIEITATKLFMVFYDTEDIFYFLESDYWKSTAFYSTFSMTLNSEILFKHSDNHHIKDNRSLKKKIHNVMTVPTPLPLSPSLIRAFLHDDFYEIMNNLNRTNTSLEEFIKCMFIMDYLRYRNTPNEQILEKELKKFNEWQNKTTEVLSTKRG